MDPIRPIFRWAGSKKQILPILSSYWKPTAGRYIEPFAGSACLFAAIRPDNAIIADLNEDLIRTYCQIKHNPEGVIEQLGVLRKSKSTYLRLRGVDSNQLTTSQQAARFLYLNRYCFNGLYRTNKNGVFNVPYGGERSGKMVTPQEIRKFSNLLQSATLIADDFESVILQAVKGDFVFMDPPYISSTRRVFSEYLPGSFTEADLARLIRALKVLDERGVDFIVSYTGSSEARKIFSDWTIKTVAVRRNIAGFTGHRRRAYEILVSNMR